ncbi:MAG: hypothetical protein P9M11_11555 [Candidatus Tenebribacter burtonii]|jgi:hypothetical protein|nr:hypothetical protein [Candidatus Tenebribacter burtonii]
MKQALQRRIELAESRAFRKYKSVDINKTMNLIADLIRNRDLLDISDPEFPDDKSFCELLNNIKK